MILPYAPQMSLALQMLYKYLFGANKIFMLQFYNITQQIKYNTQCNHW